MTNRFDDLAREHLTAARLLARSMGAETEAEDVVQEAFIKVLRHHTHFQPDRPFRPWWLQIVANETKNLHRSRLRLRRIEQRLTTIGDQQVPDDPAQLATTAEQRHQLRLALLGLGDSDQAVLRCRYLMELSEAETADRLGWPLGSVKSRTSRALRKLRKLLTEELQTS